MIGGEQPYSSRTWLAIVLPGVSVSEKPLLDDSVAVFCPKGKAREPKQKGHFFFCLLSISQCLKVSQNTASLVKEAIFEVCEPI
jgi:hypothetical protein